MNVVMLVGHLGQDPEVRQTQSGKSITTVSLATSERSKGADGNWKPETEWHRLVLFGAQGEALKKSCAKGDKVAVTGSIKTNKFQSKDGKEVKYTEILVNRIEFLSAKKAMPSAGGGGGEEAKQNRLAIVEAASAIAENKGFGPEDDIDF